jgi:hypothetical protein
MKIPSLKFGVKVTQRIPVASRFKNAPFTPGEFAESKIFASDLYTSGYIKSLFWSSASYSNRTNASNYEY